MAQETQTGTAYQPKSVRWGGRWVGGSKGSRHMHAFGFIDSVKAFDYVDHNKLWKILKEGNTRPLNLPPEKSVCRSRNSS